MISDVKSNNWMNEKKKKVEEAFLSSVRLSRLSRLSSKPPTDAFICRLHDERHFLYSYYASSRMGLCSCVRAS